MRDPKRIPEILNQLQQIWICNADLRLGQLITNVIRDPLLYYVEDQDLIEHLRENYFKKSEVRDVENN